MVPSMCASSPSNAMVGVPLPTAKLPVNTLNEPEASTMALLFHLLHYLLFSPLPNVILPVTVKSPNKLIVPTVCNSKYICSSALF